MAKVTKAMLEEKVKQLQETIELQFNQITELQQEKENILSDKEVFTKAEFEGVLHELERIRVNHEVLKGLYEKEKNKKLRNKKSEKIHNERGAGRKSNLTQEQLQTVYDLHEQGISYRKIGEEVGISKAYVCKLIKKQGVDYHK